MSDGSEQVIVVDEDDVERGVMGKLEAHQGGGVLHRAFSVFLFDSRGRLLLQRRALGKYHFAGLWANSCCSHPRPGESIPEAARRRLQEELGVSADLERVGSFIYSATDPNSGYTERELDHVLTGTCDERPEINPAEVSELRYLPLGALERELAETPGQFVPWLELALAIL